MAEAKISQQPVAESTADNAALSPLPQQPSPDPSTSQRAIDDFYFSSPQISRKLYNKGSQQNEELDMSERLLLLSRCDLLGKALSYPASLTEAQRDAVLGRPPPDVLAANIKRLMGLKSVAEAVAEFGSSERLATLRYEGLECVTRQWWTAASEDRARFADPISWEGPAETAAVALLRSLRPEEAAFEDTARDKFCSGTVHFPTDYNTDLGEIEEERPIEERAEDHALEVLRLRNKLKAQLEKTILIRHDLDLLTYTSLVSPAYL